MVQTIFDLGLHIGCDTEFYLRKGFRVIAVEANPSLVHAAGTRFSEYMERGLLHIVDRAITDGPAGEKITLHVRKDKDDWSSIFPDAAERDGAPSTAVEVATTTISCLFGEFGTPHFLKCDIEGADIFVAQQVARESIRPRYVSFELSGPDSKIIDVLAAAGYDRFQLVNQGHLRLFSPPYPPREGRYTSQIFDDKMSGLFGAELRTRDWADETRTKKRFLRWCELHAGQVGYLPRTVLRKYGKWTRRTWLVDSGWLDVHAVLRC